MNSLAAAIEPVEQQLINPIGFFVLNPVCGIGKVSQVAAWTILQTLLRFFGKQEAIVPPPKNSGWHAQLRIGELRNVAQRSAISVDHPGHRAWLRPRLDVLR